MAKRVWWARLLALTVTMVVACGAVAPAAPALAQETTTLAANPTTRLDKDKATLDAIEAALTRSNLTDKALQDLRAEVDPVTVDIQAVITELQPRVDAAKARLAQLGPKPDPKAATPEAADITTERNAQDKLFNDLDATVKRAKVLLVQGAQLETTIGGLRRGLFTRSVLAQSYSLVDPRLWGPVVRELPSDGRAIQFLVMDWVNGVASKLPTWQLATLLATVVLVLVLYEPAQRIARRAAGRGEATTKPPGPLRKVIAAIWVTALTFLVPAAALAVLSFVVAGFDLVTPRLDLLVSTFTRIALILSFNIGLARGFLAPRRPLWRIPTISDNGAEQLYRVTVTVASLVAVTRVVEALNDTIAVGLPTAVASRGILTALAAAAMAVALNRLAVETDDTVQAAAARKSQGRDWTGALRLIFWAVIVALVGALLLGFVAFAAFLALQTVVVTAICIALTLLLGLANQGVAALFDPARPVGRMFVHTLGVRRDSLEIVTILLAGILRVALIAIAILLALAPWRIESGDMLQTVQAAFFGFSIGDVTISPSAIVLAVVLFLAALAATHGTQRWLDKTLLPRTRLDAGLQNSIKTSLGYVGFIIACALSLSQLGVSFERLAIVAGALSVGIGFGLQSIVNNFVSGLILLWERAVRVGDWVVVGDEQGYVRRINVRSTEIETFDRATIIVPNSNLVSGVVKNWLRNGHVGRIKLPFTLGFGVDPEQIRAILIEEAKANDHVLSIPSPQVMLSAVGEANMRFELVCYLEEVETTQRTTSDLLFAILARFRSIGLMLPAGPATTAISSPVLDKLDAWLNAKIAEVPPHAMAGTEGDGARARS